VFCITNTEATQKMLLAQKVVKMHSKKGTYFKGLQSQAHALEVSFLIEK